MNGHQVENQRKIVAFLLQNSDHRQPFLEFVADKVDFLSYNKENKTPPFREIVSQLFAGEELEQIKKKFPEGYINKFLQIPVDYEEFREAVRLEELSRSSVSTIIENFCTENISEKTKNVLGISFYPGKSYGLIARPGVGKTAFAATIRDSFLQDGEAVYTFALEMGKEHLIERYVSFRLGIPIKSVIERDFVGKNKVLEEKFYKVLEDFKKLNWYVSEESDGNRILEIVRNLPDDIRLIELDYLQLISTGSQDRAFKLGTFMNNLTMILNDKNASLLVLAQAKREVDDRQDKRPRLGDAEWTAGFEKSCGWVASLFRPYVYFRDETITPEMAEMTVLKNRFGELGVVGLRFLPEQMKFELGDERNTKIELW